MNVTFLDTLYSIPTDIVMYRNYHHKFEQLRQRFLLYMLSNFSSCEDVRDIDAIDDKFKSIAEEVVKWLYSEDIYNRTVNDFFDDNPGYKLFQEAIYKSQVKRVDAKIAEIRGLQSAILDAEKEATSNITGIGYELYTSSIVQLAVWNAMENRIIEKQVAEADRQYKRLVAEAANFGSSRYQKTIANFNATYWLPTLKKSVELYIVVLFDKYINALIDADRFDVNAMNYIDIQRAEMLVKNMHSAANKIELIKEAFTICPFCLSVYMAAFDRKLLGENELATAEKLYLFDELSAILQEQLENILKNPAVKESVVIARMLPIATILAKINNSSVEEIIETSLSTRRATKTKELSDLRGLDYCSARFDGIIREIFSASVDDIILDFNAKDKVTEKVEKYVNSVILKDDDSEYYHEEKTNTIQALLKNTKLYVTEASLRQKMYAQKEKEHNALCESIHIQIADLENKLNHLGWFSISKKKNIENTIATLKQQEKISTDELWEARVYFSKMYR